MKKLVLAMVVIAWALAGCPYRDIPRTAILNLSEYETCLAKGTASIKGQAFVKTAGGEVRYAAGEKVYLMPVTAYSTEYFNNTIVNDIQLTPPSPLEPQPRVVIADATGNFEFTDLPACKYFVYSHIYWKYATPDGLRYTGGHANTTVDLKEGETLKVIATQ
jgi:hypothetical protein